MYKSQALNFRRSLLYNLIVKDKNELNFSRILYIYILDQLNLDSNDDEDDNKINEFDDDIEFEKINHCMD